MKVKQDRFNYHPVNRNYQVKIKVSNVASWAFQENEPPRFQNFAAMNYGGFEDRPAFLDRASDPSNPVYRLANGEKRTRKELIKSSIHYQAFRAIERDPDHFDELVKRIKSGLKVNKTMAKVLIWDLMKNNLIGTHCNGLYARRPN